MNWINCDERMPKSGIPAANNALPQPPKTSQYVPKNSANNFFIVKGLSSFESAKIKRFVDF